MASVNTIVHYYLCKVSFSGQCLLLVVCDIEGHGVVAEGLHLVSGQVLVRVLRVVVGFIAWKKKRKGRENIIFLNFIPGTFRVCVTFGVRLPMQSFSLL